MTASARLSEQTLARLGRSPIERFDYNRAAQAVGIVHLGIGAFHRAHQAWYTDRAMAGGDRDWAITGVSLRSDQVAAQLNPQDGLYTVTARSDAETRIRLIGAVREVLVASRQGAMLTERLSAPSTHIVSLTLTEKGYCRQADGSLDHDLAARPSIYTTLADGMRARQAAGSGGLTLLSCDNLADNGAQLAQLMNEYLDRHDPELARWFAAECTCPATMVDRIVPATTEADRSAIAAILDGVRDEAAVITEGFSQWVVEDRFAGPRPRWEMVGAQLVSDVAPYEIAKLRMLNGAHSALAYLGLERGYEFVHQAVADPSLRALVERLMRQEAAPTVAVAPGQDLDAYADALLARFANAALRHRLIQIAMDGSQKIPQRWLVTLAANQQQGRASPAILVALAAWLRHLRGAYHRVNDPMAPVLQTVWAREGATGIVDALFGQRGLIGGWRPSPAQHAWLTKAAADPELPLMSSESTDA